MSSSSAAVPPGSQQPLPQAIQEPLVPSINFAMVCPGVYRSGYPTKKNYRFLCALRLRSILYLCPEEYAESNLKFCEENEIEILRFATEGNKEPFMDISESLVHRILSTLIDTRKHPILIHCNKGKHRTGTIVACLRLLQGWSLVSILLEYRSFAGDKARVGDQQYVELYHPIVRVTRPYVAQWVCVTPRMTIVESEEELIAAEARQLGLSLLAPDVPEKEKGNKGSKENRVNKENRENNENRENMAASLTPSPEEAANVEKDMQSPEDGVQTVPPEMSSVLRAADSGAEQTSSSSFPLLAAPADHLIETPAESVAAKPETGGRHTVFAAAQAHAASVVTGARAAGFSTGKVKDTRKDTLSDTKRRGQR